jgi:hypothetical protein
VKTEDLIIRLAQSAAPVQPLAPPMQRFTRWALGATAATALGVILFGARSDAWALTRDASFVTIAGATLATAFLSAAAAFVLSIPGVERTPVQRWIPLLALGAWTGILALSILSGGRVGRTDPRVIHVACIVQIITIALVPIWMVFAMLRRALPLERGWSSGLATLAAVALAAGGTQFICPIDDPLHLLVGHAGPVAVLALLGAFFGVRALAAPPQRVNSP